MNSEQVLQLLGLPFSATFFAGWTMINALVAPWTELRFTDSATLVIPTLIIATVVAIAIRDCVKPHSESSTRCAKWLLFSANLLAPMLYLGAIYLLSFRGWQLLGHEPYCLVNDPKDFRIIDPTYAMLYSGVNGANTAAGWLLYTSFGLSAHIWRRLTMKEVKWYFVTLVAGWILLVLTDRYSWWLD